MIIPPQGRLNLRSGGFAVLVLPDAEHTPARRREISVILAVPLNVAV